jgi:hypothetical protein
VKAILTILLLILTSGTLLADVSKEELRRLLDARVPDAAIVAYIRKHGPVEPLSIEDITELKSAGASDDVMQALIEGSRSADALTRPSESPEPYDDSGSYYYYPYYAPFTLYPSFIYTYRPCRYRYPFYSHSYYPNHYYSPGYRSAPVPRVWVQPQILRPGGVHPYRPSTTPPPPRPNNNQPRGHPTPPRAGSGTHSPYR